MIWAGRALIVGALALTADHRGDERCVRDVPVGPSQQHRVDVFSPARRARDDVALAVVHGGGWNDPDQRRGGVSDIAARLARTHGLVTLSLEYRLVREGGVHPEPVRDLRCAARWIAANAASLGLRDPRLIIVGESAGAHLALLAAAAQAERAHAPPAECGEREAPIVGVVAVSAPTDLAAMLDAPVAGDGGREASVAVSAYLGPACASLAASDGCRGASPVAHRTALPRVLMVYSDGDHLVAPMQARALGDDRVLYVPRRMRERCPVQGSMHGFSPCLIEPAWNDLSRWIRATIYATARPR